MKPPANGPQAPKPAPEKINRDRQNWKYSRKAAAQASLVSFSATC